MDVEDENLELKLELASSRAEGVKLRSQLENSTKQLERLSRSEADLINQLNVATKVIGDNRIELDDLTFRIGSADVEIKLYKNELQDLRNKLLESEKEAKSLREQVEDLKSGAYITRTQTESSINFRLSASNAQGEDDADFGVGHDLIHDHDHQETESKIKGLEKLVEELHASLHSAEEENGTLRTMLDKTTSNSVKPTEVVDSIANVKADMAAQLAAKDAEMAALKKAHEDELNRLRVSKEEEIHALRASTNEELARLQKSVEDLEAEKAELQQHYDMLSAKQEYLAQTVPSSFTKPSELTISTNDSVGIGANPNRSSMEIVSSQTSLERAVQLYVKEGKNDDVLQEMNNLVTKFEKLKTRNTLLLNKLQSARGNIQVCCRTRPASNEEFGAGGKVIVDGHDESELSCYDWKVESWKPFGFDHVWPPEATQADVFSDVEPLIASVADGFNVCIFAYGQTGSGKTYTMEGYGTDYGIYYRSIQKLFELVQSKSFGQSTSYANASTPTNGGTSTNNGGNKKPPLSHLPSSAHTSANLRRQSLTPNSAGGTGFSALEKVFGSVGSARNSGAGKHGLGSETSSKPSSFRSDQSNDIPVIPSDQLSDTSESSANGGSSTFVSGNTPSGKSLVKQPSLFEFSNPISRRRSSLHVSSSQAPSEPRKDSTADDYGLIADRDSSQPVVKAKIEMSMLEIYNEQVYDLLTDRWTTTTATFSTSSNANNASTTNGNGSMALDLRQGTDGQVVVNGLSTMEVRDMQEAMAVFAKGASNRATASTQLNAHSSRSHLIVQIDVITEGADDTAGIHSKLFLVDLAGSERIEKSGATGSVLKEAQYINKSLLALGDVMEALDKKQSHVPYRNSKLTHLLQNALGGNARCMMIANVCPTDLTYDETMFTLQFATRVRNINLGVAHRNSNVKNLEEALKVTRMENRELKRKRQALEEALNIAKKEGSTAKIGDKFSDAKIKQMEETKKVADALIQQLQRQLHDANAKILEERRLREQAGVDAELLQRNLKKTMDQLKQEQEKARRLASSSSSAAATPSSNYGGSRLTTPTAAPRTPTATGLSTLHHSPAPVSHTPSSTISPSRHTPSSASPTPVGSRTVRAPSPAAAATTGGSPAKKPSREPSPVVRSSTSSGAAASKQVEASSSSSSHATSKTTSASVATPSAGIAASHRSSSATADQKADRSARDHATVTETSAALPMPPVVANGKETSAPPPPSYDEAVAPSPLSSPSSEAKRSSASPYKAAFAAMIQKQQSVNSRSSTSASPTRAANPTDSVTTVPAGTTKPPPSPRKDAVPASTVEEKTLTTSSKAAARSAFQKALDDSSDEEEIFEVLIPDANTIGNVEEKAPESGKGRPGMGEKKVSLDMILDDLSVASVDDVSLTELSQSTTASSHGSHATSTLAKRIAKTNPGLFQPGLVDDELVSAVNATSRGAPRPSPSSRNKRLSASPQTPGSVGSSRRQSPMPSPTTRGPMVVTPTSKVSPVRSAASPATTASARAAMVTTSSPHYRKPGQSTPSDGNSVVSNGSRRPIASGTSTPPATTGVAARTPFSQSGNHPRAAAQLRQVISSVSTPSATGTSATSGPTPKRISTSATTTPASHSALKSPSSASHAASTTSRISAKTPPSTSSVAGASRGATPRTPTTPGATPTLKQLVSENNAPYQQHVPVSALQKTPPSISDRAKAALDVHKNRMALRDTEKTEKTRSMKFLEKTPPSARK